MLPVMSSSKAIQAGLLLKEAKGKVPYGEWLSWLEDAL